MPGIRRFIYILSKLDLIKAKVNIILAKNLQLMSTLYEIAVRCIVNFHDKHYSLNIVMLKVTVRAEYLSLIIFSMLSRECG